MSQEEIHWEPTRIDLDTVDWRGNSIHLTGVPAIRNAKTGKIRLYPSEVSKSEVEHYAKEFNLEPRDVPLLLTLYVKPGVFKEGSLPTRYHLNKTLFYLWKDLEAEGLGDAFPRDEFGAYPRGPVPENLKSDAERLEAAGIVSVGVHRWGAGPRDQSVIVELTQQGMVVASQLWNRIGDPFKKEIAQVKERIFPLDPKTLRDRVHRDYPEFRKTYTELDTD